MIESGVYGAGESFGGYMPSAYDRMTGEVRKYPTQDLMEIAAMHNARAHAAQRQFLASAIGGSLEHQQRMLHNSKMGAVIKLGSQYLENLYGAGSSVDLMAGYMNVAASAGYAMNSFNRGPINSYGSGIASDYLAKSMFHKADAYFSNANGTDNRINTQGFDRTSLGRLAQIDAATGRYKGVEVIQLKEMKLSERLFRAQNDLYNSGNLTGSAVIGKLLNENKGNESLISAGANRILNDTTANGELKGVIETALKTKSGFVTNESALTDSLKNVTKMAKALVALRNVYGEVADTDIFKVGAQVTGATENQSNIYSEIRSGLQRMNVKANSLGVTTGAFAQMNSQTHSVMSQILGSASAAGAVSVDMTSSIIRQQRLNQGTSVLSPEQVAQSTFEDVNGTKMEGNMTEMMHVLHAAHVGNTPEANAVADKLTKAMMGNLDPVSQRAAIRDAKNSLTSLGVNLTKNISDADLWANAGKNATTAGGLAVMMKSAEASKLRLYAGKLGSARSEDTATKIMQALGSDGLDKLLSAEGVSGDLGKLIGAAGMDELSNFGVTYSDIRDMQRTDGNLIRKFRADAKANTKQNYEIGGSLSDKELKAKEIAESVKESRAGTNVDVTKQLNMARIGLDLLINGGKLPNENDIESYIAMEKGVEFSLNAEGTGMSIADPEKRSKFLGRYEKYFAPGQLNTMLDEKDNFKTIKDQLTRAGASVKIVGNEGVVISDEEKKVAAQKFIIDTQDAARKEAGFNISKEDYEAANDPTNTNHEEAKKRLKAAGEATLGSFGFYTPMGKANSEESTRFALDNLLEGKTKRNSSHRTEETVAMDSAALAMAIKSGAIDPKDMESVRAEFAENLLTEDKYADWRSTLGLDSLSKKQREKLVEDGSANQLMDVFLNRNQSGNLSEADQAILDQIKSGAGAGKNSVNTMIVTNLIVNDKKEK